MKKLITVLTASLLMLFALAGCADTGSTATSGTEGTATQCATAGTEPTPTVPYEQRTQVRIGVLNGPTGMGASKLMKDNQEKTTANQYTFEQYSAPTDIMPLLIKGELDIAALPTNVAATVYNKTEGGVKLLALNTLGVLYVVSKEEGIDTVADLNGKTVYISGQGSTPEYAMDYILKQNGLEVGSDVKLEFVSDHASLVAMCAAGQADTVVLPEPFVSTLLSKELGYKRSIDLNEAWDKACEGSSIFSMGCLVVRSEFADQNPQAVSDFLAEYARSVDFVNSNTKDAAELIASFKIVGEAALAEKAIPNCNIVCISGQDMLEKNDAYLRLLFEYNPAAVGGSVPGEDFYYVEK